MFTPVGISVLKGEVLMDCDSKPCPGFMVAQASVGAPLGDPSIRPMDATANRKAATTAARQVWTFLVYDMLKTEYYAGFLPSPILYV